MNAEMNAEMAKYTAKYTTVDGESQFTCIVVSSANTPPAQKADSVKHRGRPLSATQSSVRMEYPFNKARSS